MERTSKYRSYKTESFKTVACLPLKLLNDNNNNNNNNNSVTLNFFPSYSPRRDTPPGGNGFDGTPPMSFSTLETSHDQLGCAQKHGAAGWYGTDCSGYSLFTSGSILWLSRSVETLYNGVVMILERHDSFFNLSN